MKKSEKELLNLDFVITQTVKTRKNFSRRMAVKGDLTLLECTKCDGFYKLECFHRNKLGFLGRINYCMTCTRKENTKGSQSDESVVAKRFNFSNTTMLSFKVEQVVEGFKIIYAIGNSFEWNKANEIIYGHRSHAVNDIRRVSGELGTIFD